MTSIVERSEQFAHFRPEAGERGAMDQHFFSSELMHIGEVLKGRELLSSGRVQAIIPVRNELQYGAYPFVLDYFQRVAGRDNIFVIDADSVDGSYEYARNLRIPAVRQGEIEAAYDMERIKEDFGVDLHGAPGKGRTLLAGAALLYAMDTQNPEYYVFSDADIRNPDDFDHASWLASVAAKYESSGLLEVRAAQPNRNNQDVMNTFAAIQATNPIASEYFKGLKRIKWPLTGQMMKKPSIQFAMPNALGYGTELMGNLASIDAENVTSQARAQIDIQTRCMDGENSLEKETSMMAAISAFIVALNMEVFINGLRITDLKSADYRRLNARLSQMEKSFEVSVISNDRFPNQSIPLRLDRVVPSARELVDGGYIDRALLPVSWR